MGGTSVRVSVQREWQTMQPAASWARGYFGAWALSLRLRQPIIAISKANQQPVGRK
jgi:hypothetical protein